MIRYCLLTLLLVISSCEKQKVEPPEECNNYILTGDKESGCINYIDFEPNIYITPQSWEGDMSYSFDIQSDGVADFVFNTSSWSSWSGEGRISEIVPLNSNSIICSHAREDLAAKYEFDTIINYSSNWSNDNLIFAYDYKRYYLEGEQEYSHSIGGEWLSIPDSGYMGLRLIDEFDTIYAWVLMSAGRYDITIRGYAYLEKQ